MMAVRQMSGVELARRADVTTVSVSRWRTGARARSTVDPEQLFRVARALRCDYTWLMVGEGEPWTGWRTETERYEDPCRARADAVATFRRTRSGGEAAIARLRDLPPTEWSQEHWLKLLEQLDASEGSPSRARLSESSDEQATGSSSNSGAA